MPKKAPEPRHNSIGDYVGPWSIHLAYADDSDVITLTCMKQGTRWTKTKRWTVTYQPDEIEEALTDVVRIVRMAGARRLF